MRRFPFVSTSLCLCAMLEGAQAPDAADLVVINAKVVTVDPAFRIAEAVAIRGGVFVHVGTSAEAKGFIGAGTRVVDARGRAVVPGLIDSHVHALGVAAGEQREPFRELRSVAEIQEWLRDKSRRTPAGEWIWSPRTYPPRIQQRRFPTREELDAASPAHPVVIDGAYAFMLNSRALEAAGITRATEAPQGGAIVKDARGEPTGLLRNPGRLLSRFRPASERGEATSLDALAAVHRRYNEVGITSVMERGAGVDGYRAYETLAGQGRLTVRASVTIRLDSDGTLEGTEKAVRELPLRPRQGDDRLRVGPLKVVVDGGILIGNAYMRRPYGERARALYGFDDPSYRGALTLRPDQVENMLRAGHRLGWQMCSHVTGDGGVDVVLDALEAVNAEIPLRDRRYTLIHAYFPDAATARRAARLGVCVDTQPAWYFKDADVLAETLGQERLRPFIGLAEWLRAGVKVALNTDHMFGLDPDRALNPFNPFLTLATAVTRRTESGRRIGSEQAVSREDALRMMTIDAAYLSFDEKSKGSIEAGKLGDLVVLTEDFLSCPPERIRGIRAALTVLGGRVVHERP